jgi:hypothetical protein
MSALAWTLRVTVSLPTKVPAPGLKRTAREFAWAEPGAKAGGEDSRLVAHASRTKTSAAWCARSVHVLLALDIRAVQLPR